MLCGDDEPEVLQIIPVSGDFVAVFDGTDEGSHHPVYDFHLARVACWMHVKHADGATHVHPGVCMGTIVDDATHAASYLFVTAAASKADIDDEVTAFRAGRASTKEA